MTVTADKLDLVARNVRRMRQERGYSQSELARRAALAKQTLSSIEACQANPTVVTLAAIADALDVPVGWLLTEYGSPILVRHAGESGWTATPDGEFRELDQIYGFGFVRTSLVRHAHTGDPPLVHRRHRPGTLHHVFVVSGRLSLGPSGEEVPLKGGDFIRFPGDVPHQTFVWSETAVLHLVTTVPHVSQIAPRPRGNA